MAEPTRGEFLDLVKGRGGPVAVPLVRRLLSDQLTPVLAYRRLVAPDERTAASFLLESVEGGERQGRHSILGAQPSIEVLARGREVIVSDRLAGTTETHADVADPPSMARDMTRGIELIRTSATSTGGLSDCFVGGWVGFFSYDTVRYAEPEKLAWTDAPRDDRDLPDLHLGLYDNVIVFDHVEKVVNLVQVVVVAPGDDAGAAYDRAVEALETRRAHIERHTTPLASGIMGPSEAPTPMSSNTTEDQHRTMVEKALEYIRAGDIFQVVVGQRFERQSAADPFDVYRALRAVNPSPYMVYLQAPGCILVASSPEILCRVRRQEGGFVVTNRPLAGTRRRGGTPEEDAKLESDLLADRKERAEHAMLVDLGRNDVGKVAIPGSIDLASLMEIERYSHVMHISSTVTGRLRDGLDCWDALRAALPVGTISGAPKVRAMQIIDELEPVRRGPYGGGMGYIGLDGQMDVALALRTMVVPTALWDGTTWTYHVQAAGGIVADSVVRAEYLETVNKAAALARAIDVAEHAFGATASA